MQVTFTTNRLRIGPWHAQTRSPQDRAALAQRLKPILTPEVLAPLPPSFALTCGVDQWITDRVAESDVHLIEEDGALIGLLILVQPEPGGVVHLGYLLGLDSWGKGLASELVQGLRAPLRALGVPSVKAGVAIDNPASARVLEKAGFDRVSEAEGMWHYICEF